MATVFEATTCGELGDVGEDLADALVIGELELAHARRIEQQAATGKHDDLPMAGDVLQEVMATPEENDILKRLSRRRRRLVNEKGRVVNSMQKKRKSAETVYLLTKREAEILDFLVKVSLYKEIATELFISKETA